MVFVYIRIYFAARARARRAVRKPPKPKPPSSAGAIEIEERSKGVGSVGGGSVTEGSSKATTSATTGGAGGCLPQGNASRDSGVGGTNTCLSDNGGDSCSVPPTPDGRTSKQVGFQEPLTGKNEVVVTKPEITVESCSPELTASSAAAAEKEPKRQQQQQQPPPTSNCSDEDCDGGEHTQNAQERRGSGNEVEERTNNNCDSKSETFSNDVMMTNEPPGRADEEEAELSEHGSCGSSPKEAGSPTESSGAGAATREQETQDSAKVDCSKESPLVSEGKAASGSRRRQKNASMGAERGHAQNQHQPLVPTVHLKQSMDEDGCSSASNRHQQSTLAVSELESKMSELQSNGSSRPDEGSTSHSSSAKKGKGSKLHFLRVETPTIWRTSSSLSLNGDVHILGTLSRSCSRLQLDMDPVSDVEPSSSDSGAVSRCAVVKPLKLRLCQPFFGKKSATNKARRDVLDMGKLPSPKVRHFRTQKNKPTLTLSLSLL